MQNPNNLKDANRVQLINNAEELLLTKSIAFDYNSEKERNQARSRTIKQYAEERFGYGSRISTTKSPYQRDVMNQDSNYEQAKSIALGTSTMSLNKTGNKLSPELRS